MARAPLAKPNRAAAFQSEESIGGVDAKE